VRWHAWRTHFWVHNACMHATLTSFPVSAQDCAVLRTPPLSRPELEYVAVHPITRK
jgi:hypothetical protein